MPRVTLKMIAEEAGVTPAAVSMALRNHSRISAETRAHVQAIAARMGYQANPYITALMSHVRQARPVTLHSSLAVIHTFPKTTLPWMRHEPSRRLVAGIQERGQRLGFGVEMFWYNEPNITPERLSRILKARGIRGLIFLPWPQHTPTLELDWQWFSSATINYNVEAPRLHRVAEDFFGNVRLAYEELWRRGCRRIGFLSKSYHEPESKYRLLASYMRFQSLYREAGAVALEPLVPDDWRKEAVLEWYHRLRPDAIITLDWDLGRWLPEAGVRVPEEVSIALVNQCPNFPLFSGINPNYELLGAAAVDLIVEQINHNETGLPESTKEVLVRGRWEEGTQVRPLPSATASLAPFADT
jgi:LacI family transcriptional regulator